MTPNEVNAIYISLSYCKILPLMHVSVKDMLRILKQFKSNNQIALLWQIFIRLLRHPITLYNLRPNFMANDRSHKFT